MSMVVNAQHNTFINQMNKESTTGYCDKDDDVFYFSNPNIKVTSIFNVQIIVPATLHEFASYWNIRRGRQ